MDKYEPVREIGAGNFGVAKLMRNMETRELVAMKFMERGNRVCASLLVIACLLMKMKSNQIPHHSIH